MSRAPTSEYIRFSYIHHPVKMIGHQAIGCYLDIILRVGVAIAAELVVRVAYIAIDQAQELAPILVVVKNRHFGNTTVVYMIKSWRAELAIFVIDLHNFKLSHQITDVKELSLEVL